MSRFGNLVPWTHFMNRSRCLAAILVLIVGPLLFAQNQDSTNGEHETTSVSKGIDYLFNYLNMAGTMHASEFRPLTQRERTHLYLKTMVNPLGYIKAGFSAGLDQWRDKPPEWEQGASGYGRRFANIVGQYSIQRTVTFGLSSALHEDNRYFNSGKKGLWPRTGYALASGVLSRHDDGSLHLSISQVGGVASGALLSRFWLPPSQALGERRSRQLRHHHGEQYGVWNIEGISSRPGAGAWEKEKARLHSTPIGRRGRASSAPPSE